MATYTAAQLYGTGSTGENLVGAKTFVFSNTSSTAVSSYFTLETIPNQNGTFANVPQACADGVWSAPSYAGFIQTPFVASAVIQPGVTTITYTPAVSITGTNYKLKGTGTFVLTIS